MPSGAAMLSRVKPAVKTAIAGVAALYAARLFQLPEAYWAPITALIVMQSSVGATVNASWTRLAGTAVGAVVGGAFVALGAVNLLWFGAAVLIAYSLCSVLRLAESQRLATVTVAILMLIGRTSSPWAIALHRFLEVAIGIVVALLISVVIWPSRARKALRQGISEALASMETLYQIVSRGYREGSSAPVDKLKSHIDETVRRIADLFKQALYEPVGTQKDHEVVTLLVDHVNRIQLSIAALELATQDGGGDMYVRSFDTELKRLEVEISLAFEWLSDAVVAWRFDREWPDLGRFVCDLEEQAATSRKAGASKSYELEEVFRFYSFVLSSKNLVRELELTRALLTGEVAESTSRPVTAIISPG